MSAAGVGIVRVLDVAQPLRQQGLLEVTPVSAACFGAC